MIIDAIKINETYVQRMIDTAREEGVDVICGELTWEKNINAPTFNRLLDYERHLANLLDQKRGKPHAPDGNTAIPIASYAAAGGFEADLETGEMWSLIKRIERYRKKTSRSVARGAGLTTSSRRLVACMANGVSIADAWNNSVVQFTAIDTLRVGDAMWGRAESVACKGLLKWVDNLEATYLFRPFFPRGASMSQLETYLDTINQARKQFGFDKL